MLQVYGECHSSKWILLPVTKQSVGRVAAAAASVVSDSVRPHRWHATRLPVPGEGYCYLNDGQACSASANFYSTLCAFCLPHFLEKMHTFRPLVFLMVPASASILLTETGCDVNQHRPGLICCRFYSSKVWNKDRWAETSCRSQVPGCEVSPGPWRSQRTLM